MMNESGKENRDQVWPAAVRWELGLGSQHSSEIVWQCSAVRAGKLYSRDLFGTRAQAEEFAAKMRENEPDQMFDVVGIKASTVWN